MKKGWIIGVIAVLLIAVLVIVFYLKFPLVEEDKYDTAKEESITFISGWIDSLEECQGYSKFSPREKALEAGYSQFCLETTDISDFNLNKLKSLENIKGIKLDSNSGADYNFSECNSLWKLDYAWIAARVYHTIMTIYDCENKFYLEHHTYPGSPELTVYRINPGEDIINLLKEQENSFDVRYQEIIEEIQKGNEYGIANNVSDFCFPWRNYDRRCAYIQYDSYTLYNSYNLSYLSREQRIDICYEFAHKGSVAYCLRNINESEECLNYAKGDEYLVALCNLKPGKTLAYTGEPGIPAEVKTYPIVRFSD